MCGFMDVGCMSVRADGRMDGCVDVWTEDGYVDVWMCDPVRRRYRRTDDACMAHIGRREEGKGDDRIIPYLPYPSHIDPHGPAAPNSTRQENCSRAWPRRLVDTQ